MNNQQILKDVDLVVAFVSMYIDAVNGMTNQQLWEHCFLTDSHPEEHCMKVWRQRQTHCLCPKPMQTGWTEQDGKCCCNICGKEQTGETLSK